MNDFDGTIVHLVNGWSQQRPWFDAAMHGFNNNCLFKSASLVALFYAAWFREHQDLTVKRWNRSHLFITLLATVVAPIVARVLAFSLPFRARPMHEPALNFVLPLYMRSDVDIDWSSFPSDTAALIAPLVIGICKAGPRPAGILAVLIGACGLFARIYSGQHYPTDILAGVALGALTFAVLDGARIRERLVKPAFTVLERWPGIFYALFFLLTYQIANVFWETFNVVNYVTHDMFLHARISNGQGS